MPTRTRYDAVVIGSGHNGLVAAAYLAAPASRCSCSNGTTGSAAPPPRSASSRPRGVPLPLLLLVSLLPASSSTSWGSRSRPGAGARHRSRRTKMRRARPAASCSPTWTRPARRRPCTNSPARTRRGGSTSGCWSSRRLRREGVASFSSPAHARRVPRHDADRGGARAWEGIVERPLGRLLERYADHDVLRGLLMTDGKIGVFAHAHIRRCCRTAASSTTSWAMAPESGACPWAACGRWSRRCSPRPRARRGVLTEAPRPRARGGDTHAVTFEHEGGK